MLACLLSCLLACGAQAPSKPLQIPAGARLGIAWTKPALLSEARWKLLEVQTGLRPLAELAQLGVWPKEAQARADALDVDLVVLVRDAKCASAGPITHEYGNKSGKTGRIRFIGAESELTLEFLRRGDGWESRGSWHKELKASAPPQGTLGEKEDVVVDPDLQLGAMLLEGFNAGADFMVGEVLWLQRVAIRERSSRLEVEESRDLWTLAREVLPSSVAAAPRATLAEAAAQDWLTWRKRYETSGVKAEVPGTCAWCGGPTVERSCACSNTIALSALIQFTSHALTPWPPDPRASGSNPATALRGDRPQTTMLSADTLRAKLASLPSSDLKEAWEQFEAERPPWSRKSVKVIVVGNSFPAELLQRMDGDYARPSRDFLYRGRDSFQDTLDQWKVIEKPPLALLVEIDPTYKQKPKVLRLVKGRSLDSAALQGLLEQALWAEFRGR